MEEGKGGHGTLRVPSDLDLVSLVEGLVQARGTEVWVLVDDNRVWGSLHDIGTKCVNG